MTKLKSKKYICYAEQTLNMFHIPIVVVLLILGGVRATIYENVESIAFLAESNRNPYFTIRIERSDEGPIYWLDILQDITPKLGIQLCEKWEYDTRGFGGDTCGSGGGGGGGAPVPPHNGTIRGPICWEFCSFLDHLDKRNSDIPGPGAMLGLRERHCPLKKGSIQVSRLTMPKVFNVDLQIERDYVDYEAILASIHCNAKNFKPFVTVTLVFFPCDRKH